MRSLPIGPVDRTLLIVLLIVGGLVAFAIYKAKAVAASQHKGFWDTVDDIGVSGNKYVGSSAAKILGAIGL